MAKVCKRFIISGQVQSVSYRQSTAKKAEDLKICGSVRNLSDGRVEVIACAEEKEVNALARWLWEGPPGSSVQSIRVEPVLESMLNMDDFHIRY